MVGGKFKGIDVDLICYSCSSEYGSSNCSGCAHYGLGLGDKNKYEPIDNSNVTKEDIVMNDANQTNSLKAKLDTIEINIPENINTVYINGIQIDANNIKEKKKDKKKTKVKFYSQLFEQEYTFGKSVDEQLNEYLEEHKNVKVDKFSYKHSRKGCEEYLFVIFQIIDED